MPNDWILRTRTAGPRHSSTLTSVFIAVIVVPCFIPCVSARYRTLNSSEGPVMPPDSETGKTRVYTHASRLTHFVAALVVIFIVQIRDGRLIAKVHNSYLLERPNHPVRL